jgi:hypothetical protein
LERLIIIDPMRRGFYRYKIASLSLQTDSADNP